MTIRNVIPITYISDSTDGPADSTALHAAKYPILPIITPPMEGEITFSHLDRHARLNGFPSLIIVKNLVERGKYWKKFYLNGFDCNQTGFVADLDTCWRDYIWNTLLLPGIQEDWINCPEDAKPIIDAKFISETIKTHQAAIRMGIHYLMENNRRATEITTSLDTMATLLAVDDIATKDRSWAHDKALEIVTNTTSGDHFTPRTLEKVVSYQESLKRNIGKGPEEIARLAIENLRKRKSDKRSATFPDF